MVFLLTPYRAVLFEDLIRLCTCIKYRYKTKQIHGCIAIRDASISQPIVIYTCIKMYELKFAIIRPVELSTTNTTVVFREYFTDSHCKPQFSKRLGAIETAKFK